MVEEEPDREHPQIRIKDFALSRSQYDQLVRSLQDPSCCLLLQHNTWGVSTVAEFLGQGTTQCCTMFCPKKGPGASGGSPTRTIRPTLSSESVDRNFQVSSCCGQTHLVASSAATLLANQYTERLDDGELCRCFYLERHACPVVSLAIHALHVVQVSWRWSWLI